MYRLKGIFVVLLICSGSVYANPNAAKGPDFSIFEVRRELALSNDQKTEKDFYIYAGSDEGVKEGSVYTVVRNVPLYDGFQNRSLGEMKIKVAKVKIIFVDKNVSVARFYEGFSRESIPVLRENHILLGDMIDVSSQTSVKASKVEEKEGDRQPSGVKLVINSIDVTENSYHP